MKTTCTDCEHDDCLMQGETFTCCYCKRELPLCATSPDVYEGCCDECLGHSPDLDYRLQRWLDERQADLLHERNER